MMNFSLVPVRKWPAAAAAAFVLTMSGVLALAGDLSARYSFAIAPQSLSSALLAFSEVTDIQVSTASADLKDLQSSGIVGERTASEALQILVAGTNLTFRVMAQNAIVIEPRKGQEGDKTKVSSRNDGMQLAHTQIQQTEGNEGSSGDPQNTAQGQAQNPPRDQNKAIEEIIVTATKRAERIQDVPMSITAITAAEISRRGLVSGEDYLRGIPGVAERGTGLIGNTIVIRGMETTAHNQNFTSGSNTGTYFGETPTTTSAGIFGGANVDLKLVDIERVEVLRGPQGTAFGSSSMGGTVRTIPKAPTLDRVEGELTGGYSVTAGTGGDNYKVQGVLNVPVVKDKLALRAVAYLHEDSGFYSNVGASNPSPTIQTSVTQLGAFAADADEQGSSNFTGGRVAALLRATDALSFTLSYVTQKTERNGQAIANSGPYEQGVLLVPPEHQVRGERFGLFDTDIDIANAKMEYDLGWGNLLATYSYIKSGSLLIWPTTSINLALPSSWMLPSDHRENVGEIRLATSFDGAWNFLVGLYAEDVKDDLGYDILWHADPAMNVFAPGTRSLGVRRDQRTQKQKAVFAEASWEFLPGLTLTGGGRFFNYDRTFEDRATGPFYGGPTGLHLVGDSDESGSTFRANLSYKPSEQAHLYAGWSQGFRLGRPQPGVPANLCDVDGDGFVDGSNYSVEATRSISHDAVDAYELGGKFLLSERRVTLDAAIYRMDWSDMPVGLRGDCPIIFLVNAGKARSEGVEAHLGLTLDAFSLDVGGSLVNARVIEDLPALGFEAGSRLPSPRVNGNLGLQYDFANSGYKPSVRLDATYVGPYYMSLLGAATPNTRAGDYVQLDASVQIMIRNTAINLFARNLTDEDAFVAREGGNSGPYFGVLMRPRTVGLQLSHSFR